MRTARKVSGDVTDPRLRKDLDAFIGQDSEVRRLFEWHAMDGEKYFLLTIHRCLQTISHDSI